MESGTILQAIGFNKTYPGVKALDAVDFDLEYGEVQALVGQNGAGKSTFVEIIAGSIRPDSGQIKIDNTIYPYLEPSKSIELGIQTVHQENQLVDELSIADNIYLFNLPTNKIGLVKESDCTQAANELLQELGIDIPAGKKIKQLTFAEKKLISIAKAFSRKARILILDEPTASLDEKGKKILFDIIRKHTKKGLSVIYISHNIHEVFEICDRVTVFKDGKKVSTQPVKEISLNDIVRQMIGRSTTNLYSREKGLSPAVKNEGLEVIDYHREGVIEHISFQVKAGEIFGISGLVGAGRTELVRMVFGLDKKDSGKLIFRGQDITPTNPNDAIKKGIGFLTEDRKDTGLVMMRPIFENISLVKLAKEANQMLNLALERNETQRISEQLNIKTPSISQLVLNLSGGNQQKVVLAKWLFAGAEILFFDEPTVGIDVGAKSEIYKLIDNLATQGKIIILISSDNPELIAVCNRVGVMRNGRLITVLEGNNITEENILRYSMGVNEKD